MINNILKKSKRFSNKSSQSYLKHFEYALVNFDKFIKEEKADYRKFRILNTTIHF